MRVAYKVKVFGLLILLIAAILPVGAQDEQDEVVAQVNGQDITREEFIREFDRRAGAFAAQEAESAILAIQVLDALIEQEIIKQAAVELEVTITEEELNAELENLRNSIAPGEEAWQEWLDSNSYTENELREAVLNSLITNRVRDVVVGDLSGDVLQAHARHILLDSEEEAQRALDRLNNGADFASVALDLSIDATTREQGGDLGWFTRKELLEESLAEIAFSLEPGEIAGPIRSSLGYHIIQTIEVAERPIEPERLPALMENQFLNWLETRFEAADIERFLGEDGQSS